MNSAELQAVYGGQQPDEIDSIDKTLGVLDDDEMLNSAYAQGWGM